MFDLSPLSFLLVAALALFMLGVGSMIAGVIILVGRVSGKHVQTLAAQTTQIAQKGIAEDIAGLVGNASNLLDALNQLLRTTTGIAIFLNLLGLTMIAAACWLAIQIYPVWP